MAVGDRVQHVPSNRLGTVRNIEYLSSGTRRTEVCWDAMGRLQEEHERTGWYQDGQFIYIGGLATATQVSEMHEAARIAVHQRRMLVESDPVMAFDLSSEPDRTAVMTWRMNPDGTVDAIHRDAPVPHQPVPRPVDPELNRQAVELVQRGGLIQALLNADRADIEAFRREFQGLPGVPGMTGAMGAMGAMGTPGAQGPRGDMGPRGRSFDDPTEEEERAAREGQVSVAATTFNKNRMSPTLRPKLFGGKRRVTGLD